MANKSNGHVVIGIDGDASEFEKTLGKLGSKTKAGLADIKAGIDMTTAAAKGLLDVASKGVQYTANIEQLKTSFEVMTGSAEKAAEVVNRLRTMGAETPFEMADLAGVTQLLMQYGFTADDAIEKMRMLGDIAQGNSEAMTSIAMGYAQMASAGKVNLQDIKQMINGGFNPLQEISERTGESMASLYDRISRGTMSVDEITQSMRYATSEGGKFFGSMDKQSKTLSGQLSTLKDNADQLLGSLTQGISDDLRDELLPLANNMISTLQEAFDQRGMEGLLSAATDMLPSLLDMMTGRMEDSISALSKFAPKAVTAIMKGIPGAIRSGSSVLPQITSALFDVAGLVVSELVTMLPELVPSVISGFAGLLNESINGIGKLLGGFYSGIEQLAHKGQKKIAGVWVDQKAIAKYDFSVDVGEIDTETPANEVKNGLETVLKNIGDKLTDGLADDSETVKTLEAKVRGWADDAYSKINGWYKNEIEKLNASGATGEKYDAKLLEIETKANEMRDGVQAAEVDAIGFLNSMAGQSTAYVQQHLDELKAIGEAAGAVVEEIDKLANEAHSAAANAFNVVRSGASADEATVSMAIKYKFTEFSLDTQAAEDTYTAAVKELNAQFAAGEIGKDEYNDLTSQKAAELESAKAGAKAAYEQALGEIFTGIAKSEGISAAVEDAGLKYQMFEAIEEAFIAIRDIDTGSYDNALGTEFTNLLAEYLSIDPNILNATPMTIVSGYVETWVAELLFEAEEALKNADNTKLQEAYAAALEGGKLSGTDFDTTDQAKQFAAIIGGTMTEAGELAKPEAEAVGESLVASTGDGAANSGAVGAGRGDDYGSSYVKAVGSWAAAAYRAGKKLSQSTAKGTADGQESASPSKVARKLGNDFGDGYGIGLQQSMARAAAVARRVTGHIATAADISQNMRVNIPTLQQDIMIANEQMPIKLYVNGREFAQTTATDTNRAQNSYKRSIALGVGK